MELNAAMANSQTQVSTSNEDPWLLLQALRRLLSPKMESFPTIKIECPNCKNTTTYKYDIEMISHDKLAPTSCPYCNQVSEPKIVNLPQNFLVRLCRAPRKCTFDNKNLPKF